MCVCVCVCVCVSAVDGVMAVDSISEEPGDRVITLRVSCCSSTFNSSQCGNWCKVRVF